ncbi:hypothetical protein VC83_09499 [Pseudogymnoascus destructans]|uniref:Uncharacterized protein n=1 Tax=Pseudogymnoascus destructans TaxID=655981 RepID=A0A176ZWF0_9PEZI|nr:uncharacterized protein VC83_09499 [Pseudogymnoascus destructans]OAF54238.1 hypothetical protein VC83_09499 [Pseudogymnoascus destructans]
MMSVLHMGPPTQLGDDFNEDEGYVDEGYVDEGYVDEGYFDEEDGEYEEEDDFTYIKRETRHERPSRSSRKRRRAAAAGDGVTLDDEDAGAVEGGKLDAAIRSEMKGLSPHMRPYYHPHSRMSGLPYKKKVTSSLKVCVSMKALVQHFLAVFPPDHFFEALTFLHHYVDIIRSSALGQCYMEGIYSHFRARAKLFLDWESDPSAKVESPYTKARLVDFMEMFLVVPDYEQLERDDFYELTSKRINNRPVARCRRRRNGRV